VSAIPHISPGEPFDLRKRLFFYELAMIQALTQNDSVFYPVFGTIWPAHLERSLSNHSDGYAFSSDHSTCLAISPQNSGSR
jgi:hypothetical protein